jgi:hypothetical protein
VSGTCPTKKRTKISIFHKIKRTGKKFFFSETGEKNIFLSRHLKDGREDLITSVGCDSEA